MLSNRRNRLGAPAIVSIVLAGSGVLTLCGCPDSSGCSHGKEPNALTGTCEAYCGDGEVVLPEECDDGNRIDDDACDNSCKLGRLCFTAAEGTLCPDQCTPMIDCGHGECVDTDQGPSCECTRGYFGLHCDKKLLITAGANFTVARNIDGNVVAWGNNGSGQLASSSAGDSSTVAMTIADLPGLYSVKQLSASPTGTHALALDNDGRIWAWGENADEQLGIPMKSDKNQVVEYINPAAPAEVGPTWVAAGFRHSLAIYKNNIHTWGLDDPIAPEWSFYEAAACSDWNLAIGGGDVYSWGSNNGYGQLGTGNMMAQVDPIKLIIPTDTQLIDVDCGEGHSIALSEGGRVWAWGWNKSYQLSDYVDEFMSPVPAEMTFDDDGEEPDEDIKIVAIAAGASHNVALDADGHVWTWGEHSYGQLGHGLNAPEKSTRPRRVRKANMELLSNIVVIEAGGFFTLAMDKSGVLWAWGDNESGQLGITDPKKETDRPNESDFQFRESVSK